METEIFECRNLLMALKKNWASMRMAIFARLMLIHPLISNRWLPRAPAARRHDTTEKAERDKNYAAIAVTVSVTRLSSPLS